MAKLSQEVDLEIIRKGKNVVKDFDKSKEILCIPKKGRANMTWHYQVFKVVSKSKKHEPYFCIKELFEGKIGNRKGPGWTKDPIAPIADTHEELVDTLIMMLKDAIYYKKAKVERLE